MIFTVRVHVPLAQEKNQLIFGKIWIDFGEGDHMERQVPRSIPWVLPLVGHANNVAIE